MKRTATYIVAALAVAGLGASGYGLYHAGMEKGAAQAAGAAPSQGERRVLYWHDPMAPGTKFDKPGKSPYMDMDLVPVYADEQATSGGVSIDPTLQQNLGIRTARVSAGTFAAPVAAVGSVAYDERLVELVQARANGFLERLYVRAQLDPVRKGQPLAELYVPEWVAAQEEFLVARRLGDAQLVDAARQRMRLVGMDEEQVRRVAASGKVHPRITLTAPVSGIVSELAVREGATVMAGAPLFRINGLQTVWIDVDVQESNAARVRRGAPAKVTVPAFPGTALQGRVSAVLPQVASETRTLKARIELPNPGMRLVPGMFAQVHLTPPAGAGALVVPTEAVIRTGARTVVIAALGEGKFRPVEVRTGMEGGGRTEITGPLEEGQQVVVSGQFLLDSEASLKGVEARMQAAPAPAAAGDEHAGHDAPAPAPAPAPAIKDKPVATPATQRAPAPATASATAVTGEHAGHGGAQ